MSYGTGKPRFLKGAFDFTPDKFYQLVEREPESANIIRTNPITDNRIIIEKGQYLKHRYLFYGLTWEQITAWKDLQSTVITHQPHSDNGYNYEAIIMSVIDYKDKNPENRVLEVILESEDYAEYEYREIIVTSPTNFDKIFRGEAVGIAWTSQNCETKVDIHLYKDGAYDSVIVADTDNDGSYIWTLPVDIAIASGYTIRVINDGDALTYGESDAFEVLYGGFIKFDGSNDYMPTKILGASAVRTYAFNFKTGVVADTSYRFLINGRDGATNYEDIRLHNSGGALRLKYYSVAASGAQAEIRSSGLSTNTWYTAIVRIDRNAAENDRVKIYINGVADTAIANAATDTAPTLTKKYDIGVYRSPSETSTTTFDYYFLGDMKQILITSHAFSNADIANYHAGNVNEIANKIMWLPCNDIDPGTGAPYTDAVLDISSNDNHCTPINIDAATFFNRT